MCMIILYYIILDEVYFLLKKRYFNVHLITDVSATLNQVLNYV